jgi:prepilin-type N-terminal cleavage/methylation domain-containing protein
MGTLRHRLTRHRRWGEGGFTLIELLVVIAILSVLAAIVIINVTGVKNTANTAACNTDTQEVQTAVNAYYDDNNDLYPSGWGSTVTTLDNTDLADNLSSYLSNTTSLVGTGAACASFTATVTNGELLITGTPNKT